MLTLGVGISSRHWLLHMKNILPPTLVLYCMLGMLILHWRIPLISIANVAFVISGLCLVIFGIVIASASERQFRRNGTTVNAFGSPIRLVTDGWFKYSRNPMYLGFALMLAGVWLMLGSLSPILGIVTFLAAADRGYIPIEEARLREIFGKEYETYRTHTRRWL